MYREWANESSVSLSFDCHLLNLYSLPTSFSCTLLIKTSSLDSSCTINWKLCSLLSPPLGIWRLTQIQACRIWWMFTCLLFSLFLSLSPSSLFPCIFIFPKNQPFLSFCISAVVGVDGTRAEAFSLALEHLITPREWLFEVSHFERYLGEPSCARGTSAINDLLHRSGSVPLTRWDSVSSSAEKKVSKWSINHSTWSDVIRQSFPPNSTLGHILVCLKTTWNNLRDLASYWACFQLIRPSTNHFGVLVTPSLLIYSLSWH